MSTSNEHDEINREEKTIEPKNEDAISAENSQAPESDELVNLMGGSHIIDIGMLRKAQAMEFEDLDDLYQDADALLAEMKNDPELQKDVLDGFTTESSDLELASLKDSVERQTESDLEKMAEAMESLSEEVSGELQGLNLQMEIEDSQLEKLLSDEASEEGLSMEEAEERDPELLAALPQETADGQVDLEDLASCIQALLFYSERPQSLKKIKEMLEMSDAEDSLFLSAIEILKAEYQKPFHGFELMEIAGGYQLRTKMKRAPLLRKLAKVQVQRLSRGAMETLTLVAYKQPCTKEDVDEIRGVDSSHFIRTLLDRKLIEVKGRSESAGRPMIYGTTDTFLEVFGIMDLQALPPLREIEAMVPNLSQMDENGEDPRVVQMRKMVEKMNIEANLLDYSAKDDEVILQEIKDRVKAIEITSPYMERMKQLAQEGIQGEDAEKILAREFGFEQNLNPDQPEIQPEMNFTAPEQMITETEEPHVQSEQS